MGIPWLRGLECGQVAGMEGGTTEEGVALGAPGVPNAQAWGGGKTVS